MRRTLIRNRLRPIDKRRRAFTDEVEEQVAQLYRTPENGRFLSLDDVAARTNMSRTGVQGILRRRGALYDPLAGRTT